VKSNAKLWVVPKGGVFYVTFYDFYSAPNARYCVKTTARSTVQFAPLDSKMCLVL